MSSAKVTSIAPTKPPKSPGARRQARHRERIGELQQENAELRTQLEGRKPEAPSKVLLAVTVGTAITLPAFSVSATLQTGTLWAQGSVAMWATGFIAVCLFLVSTRHVAQGVQRAMRVGLLDGWLLALAIDGAIVGGEVARLGGGVDALAWSSMAAGAVLSAVFNAIGFTAETTP